MTKSELRKQYKVKRAQLSPEELEEKSLAIANQSLALSIWDKSIYHIFLSIKKHKEVNTHYLQHILDGKDKNIAISKSDFATHQMKHFLLTDNTVIRINSWGIPEPENGIELQSKQIDVIFIPLLAFDKKGNRTGYGKGFYDRFLQTCRPDSLKIGLSFFEAEQEKMETHPHDIALNYCITPEKIYSF